MTREVEERLIEELMESMSMPEGERSIAKRYVRRTVDHILIYCNRLDLPEQLHSTVIQIAEDLLKADMVKMEEKDVASIQRGDTAISYRSNSATHQPTVDFMKNHEKFLNRFKKINLPKDLGRV